MKDSMETIKHRMYRVGISDADAEHLLKKYQVQPKTTPKAKKYSIKVT